jgi:signal peptidase II
MLFSKTKFITLILLLFFIIDRITKYFALNKLYEKGVYFFKYFQLQLQTNPGIAFGILLPKFLIIFLTIIIIFFIFSYFFKSIKKERYLEAFLLGLIIIGAISNLLDRIFYKEVIDFIQINIWPTFNLADAYISIGVILFLIINIKKDSEKNISRAL